MATRKSKKENTHTCVECARPVYDMKEINMTNSNTGARRPFLLRCPVCTKFKGARFEDEPACELFIPKTIQQ